MQNIYHTKTLHNEQTNEKLFLKFINSVLFTCLGVKQQIVLYVSYQRPPLIG